LCEENVSGIIPKEEFAKHILELFVFKTLAVGIIPYQSCENIFFATNYIRALFLPKKCGNHFAMTSMFRAKNRDRCHNSIVLNGEKQKLL